MQTLKLRVKIIEKAKKNLAKKHGIKTDNLKYIGFSDCDFIQPGSKMLQFNITKKEHQFYKSTVAWSYNPITLKEKILIIIVFILVTGIAGCIVGSYLKDFRIGGWF